MEFEIDCYVVLGKGNGVYVLLDVSIRNGVFFLLFDLSINKLECVANN